VAMGKGRPPLLDQATQFAADHGVKLGPRDAPASWSITRDNAQVTRRLRPQHRANYDPSHMFWQGIEPIKAIRVLGDSIFHVHAKDTPDLRLEPAQDRRARHETVHRREESAWIFRTVGFGHGAEWWSEFISTLRMYGYDYVLSIEHEDSLMSPNEGLTKAAEFLNRHRPSARRLPLPGGSKTSAPERIRPWRRRLRLR